MATEAGHLGHAILLLAGMQVDAGEDEDNPTHCGAKLAQRPLHGAFGVGPHFCNPVDKVASMWKDMLFTEAEFQGRFDNIVFAIEKPLSASQDSHAGSSSSTPSRDTTDFDIFKHTFDLSQLYPFTYVEHHK